MAITKEQQARFLLRLEESGIAARAARQTDLKPSDLYVLRRNDEDFKAAWDESLEIGMKACEDLARERAFFGVPKTVYYKGDPVGTDMQMSDTLAKVFLEGDNPNKYRRADMKIDLSAQFAAMSDEELNAEIEKKISQVGSKA